MMTKILILALMGVLLFAAVAGVAADKPVTLSGADAGIKETELGDMVADAIRETAGADIAIIHAMAFRPDAAIEKGAVQPDSARSDTPLKIDKNIVNEQALRNCLSSPTTKIATLSLTPASLYAVMKRATAKLPEKNVAFLQVSGLAVKVQGGKVKEIMAGARLLDPTDNKTKLTVAMPLDLALGAATYIIEFNDEVRKGMTIRQSTVLDACTALVQSDAYVLKTKRITIEK